MDNARPTSGRPATSGRLFTDVDALRDQLAGWDVEFTQLAAGPVVGSHGMRRIGSVVVQGGETLVPLIQRGAAPPLATFSVLANSTIRLTSRGRTHGGDRVFINRPGDEIHWRSDRDFRVRTLSVDEGSLRRVAGELGLERGVDTALRAHSVRPSHRALTALRRAVFDDVSIGLAPAGGGSFAAMSDVKTERRLLHVLTRALASHGGTAEPERLRQMDLVMLRFQAVLSRHPDRAFGRGELSEAVGAGDRSIHRAAQAWCGTSPLSLVKTRRLHAARRDLRSARPRDCRVIDVAVRRGFTHMSRFAGEYRALFGELPSETLHATRRDRRRP